MSWSPGAERSGEGLVPPERSDGGRCLPAEERGREVRGPQFPTEDLSRDG